MKILTKIPFYLFAMSNNMIGICHTSVSIVKAKLTTLDTEYKIEHLQSTLIRGFHSLNDNRCGRLDRYTNGSDDSQSS